MSQTFLLPEFETEEREKPVNVASVPQRSPFRYPGGKTWLVPLFRRWMMSLPKQPTVLVEPFAGGGIISLTTAFEQLADRVVMVELDEQIAAVWKTILGGDAEWLAKRILSFDLTTDSAKAEFAQNPKSNRELAFQRKEIRSKAVAGRAALKSTAIILSRAKAPPMAGLLIFLLSSGTHAERNLLL